MPESFLAYITAWSRSRSPPSRTPTRTATRTTTCTSSAPPVWPEKTLCIRVFILLPILAICMSLSVLSQMGGHRSGVLPRTIMSKTCLKFKSDKSKGPISVTFCSSYKKILIWWCFSMVKGIIFIIWLHYIAYWLVWQSKSSSIERSFTLFILMTLCMNFHEVDISEESTIFIPILSWNSTVICIVWGKNRLVFGQLKKSFNWSRTSMAYDMKESKTRD